MTPHDAPYKKLQRLKIVPVLYYSNIPTGLFKMRDGREYFYKDNKENRKPSLRRVR